jgi:hypothetical protein
MSEAPKTVEEPVVAAAVESAAPVVEPTPAVAEPTTEAPATEAAAEVTEPAVEAEATTPEEVKPVEEGTLGYKGPGLLK